MGSAGVDSIERVRSDEEGRAVGDEPRSARIDEDATLDELTHRECLELLATQSVGRLAVPQGRQGPLVVPVNYVLDGETILFRSGYGAKLRGAVIRPVSFEVDSIDEATRTGWSVLARGRAQEIHGRHARGGPPEPWMPGDKPYLVRLTIRTLTGRRIGRPEGGQPA
jgi:hypothetical protein